MLEKLTKYNIPWLFSIFIHSFALFYLANLKSLPEVRQEEISVAITLISVVESPKINNQNNRSKNIINNEIVKVDQKPELEKEIHKSDKSDDEVVKESDKMSKEVITDLSYSRHIYKIGSKQNPTPPYPRIAKLRNYQGNVEISVLSDFKGNVVNAKIYKSSGYPILDKSALVTLKKWHFDILASSINKNRYYRIIVPINFIL
jgi:TonB family protein